MRHNLRRSVSHREMLIHLSPDSALLTRLLKALGIPHFSIGGLGGGDICGRSILEKIFIEFREDISIELRFSDAKFDTMCVKELRDPLRQTQGAMSSQELKVLRILL
jgi:hypothetical protein